MDYHILTINPGSTSTKIAVFINENLSFEETVRHKPEDLAAFEHMAEQQHFRRDTIIASLAAQNYDVKQLSAVVGRGGLLHPIEGGTYEINQSMLRDLESYKYGEHACNLGAILAHEIASEQQIPSYIVDPVVVDELSDLARVSGYNGIERRSIFHALNQKAVSRKVIAEKLGKRYEDATVVVVHMGGGVSVGIHHNGRVIDVNNALDGDGPMSPERTGGLPFRDVLRIASENKDKTAAQITRMFVGKGGYVSYFGTSDAREIEERVIAGNAAAKLVHDGMAYQISKEICSLAAAVSGKIDGIILTGGMAYSKILCEFISERCQWMAPIYVYPGENELEALALGALRVLRGEEKPHQYTAV